MESIKSSAVSLPKKKSLLVRILTCWELYVFLIPGLVAAITFYYVPMYGVTLAFKELIPGRTIMESPWVGFAHFKRFFSLPNCWELIWATMKLALSSTILLFPIPIIFALSLNQVRSQFSRKLVQNISYMPYLFSVVIVVSITNVFLAPNSGIINILIQKMGGEQILFFGHDKYVIPIYLITNVWHSMGYDAVIYIAALAGIDQEQLEAARIDGANRMRIIWHIEIPAIAGTIVTLLILRWGHLLSVGADKMLLLQTPLNLGASEILSTYIYKVGLLESQFGFSTAVGLFNTVVNIISLLVVNTIAKKVNDTSIF